MRDAKEKAKELLDKYWNHEYFEHTNTGRADDNARQCALICVNEILSEYSVLQIETSFCFEMYKWWSEVKKQIVEYES